MAPRRPRLQTPFRRTYERFVRVASRPYLQVPEKVRLVSAFLLLVLVCTLLLMHGMSRAPVDDYSLGEVVRRNVVSPADITSEDAAETARKRQEVSSAVRPIFTYDPTVVENRTASFKNSWSSLQRQLEAGTDLSELKWSGEGGPELGRVFATRKLDNSNMDKALRILNEVGNTRIYPDSESEFFANEITLVDTRTPSATTVMQSPKTSMTPLSAARKSLEEKIAAMPGWSAEQEAAFSAALTPMVRPNVLFDKTATELAKAAAAERVSPATISLKRNQVVAREGDTVSVPMLSQFAAIREHGRGGKRWHHFFGLLVLVGALLLTAWRFTFKRGRASSIGLSRNKAFALIGSAIVVETVLMRVGFTLADRVTTASMAPPLNDATVWSFAIPFAAATLLVGLRLDAQLAFITAIVTSLFAAVLAPNGVPMAFYSFVSSTAAIYGISRYRERQSVTLAGLFSGAVNAVLAVAIIAYAQQPLVLLTILVAVGCGLLGGLLTSIFTAGGLPVNESAFGILTDVKLLELSNADLPVLGQMALRAPGTNQHSHAVGQLAEEACRAIGANALLARIGALYHDIGKLAAPDMFVENQQGHNPHDKIRPTNSARIITSHVTYGLKLAKEIGLPERIADFIPQHHGTRTLHFFLRKAQAQAPEGEVVDESEFRYPGPKPQFKEAAVMMIADSCEAAARSLSRPDPENIRAIVNKIIDAILTDGQLDECDLTLQELTTIRETVTTSLTAIYHARIDYPGFNPPPVSGAFKLTDSAFRSGNKAAAYDKLAEVPINEGGEVEDEAMSRRKATGR